MEWDGINFLDVVAFMNEMFPPSLSKRSYKSIFHNREPEQSLFVRHSRGCC